jgi:hypothetical protein
MMKKTCLLFLAVFLVFAVSGIGYAQTSVIKMNEIYSRGVTSAPDWIEIYNGSSVSVNIAGYKIYDNGGQGGTKPKMVLPTGSIIPAKSFLVIVTDISTSVDPSGFGLSSGGEKVWLEDATGAIADSITFPAMDTTQTYSRMPDGGTWKLVTPLTRGSSNSLTLMNEIYSRGVTNDPDWIELYNTTSAQLDISGYKIYDSGGQAGTKPKMTFPTGTVIPANGFFAVVTDISTSIDPSGFGLSSGGETVWLEDKSGAIIDSIAFTAMDTSQSYGRYPDGKAWALLNKRTKGASNGTATGVEQTVSVPTVFGLEQNYPNPFNPSTTFRFRVAESGSVTLKVFNLLGKEVATLMSGQKNAGTFTVLWDAAGQPSGVYVARLVSVSDSKKMNVETRRLMLLK